MLDTFIDTNVFVFHLDATGAGKRAVADLVAHQASRSRSRFLDATTAITLCFHSAFKSESNMTTLSIRGLDDQALAELKKRAALEDASVNTLVLRLIAQGLGHQAVKPALKRHGDLDALAGTWSAADLAEFETATHAFSQIDQSQWT